jgi:hypothetical protein
MAQSVAAARSNGNPIQLNGQQRLEVVAAAETRGAGETLASVGQTYGVGRTFVFESRRRARTALEPRTSGPRPGVAELARLRGQVERLDAENRRLQAELEQARTSLNRSVEVTDERKLGTIAELAVAPVSTRNISKILRKAFGPEHALADNTVARIINMLGGVAGRILEESGARERVVHGCPDEIFFHQIPILGVAEPRSMSIPILLRTNTRDAESWQVVFQELPNMERGTGDRGTGLTAAMRREGIEDQLDIFHAGREFNIPQRKLEKVLRQAFEKERREQKKIEQRKGPGRRPTKALERAKAESDALTEDLEHFLKSKELFDQATSPFSREHRLATFDSQLELLSQAIAELDKVQVNIKAIKKLRGYLERNKEVLVVFTKRLWELEVQLRDDANPWWTPRRIIAAAAWPLGLCEAIRRENNPDEVKRLCGLLPRAYDLRVQALKQCDNFAQVEVQLIDRLKNLERASSAIESLNAKFRVVQAVKKQVNQPFLNLFALCHNLTPFERSRKRRGRSPFEILGVRLEGDEGGWLGVLMTRARREGLLD